MHMWHDNNIQLQKTFGTSINWGRWSYIVEIKLPEITSGEIISENISSMSVLEWKSSWL